MCVLKVPNSTTPTGHSLLYKPKTSKTYKTFSEDTTKAWIAIDRLPTIWKSNQTGKIKLDFLLVDRVNTTIWMYHVDANQSHKKSYVGITEECNKIF